MTGSDHVYRIGYWSCEESPSAELTHFRKLSEEELTEFIEDATIKAIQREKAKKHNYISSFQDVFDDVIEILVAEYGFKTLEVVASWHCFGWASMFREGEWKSWRGELPDELSPIIKKVHLAGFTAKDDSFLADRRKIIKETMSDDLTEEKDAE